MTKRSSKPRPYRSPVREEAQERTRERILAAVMDHLSADAGEVTLRAIARRAQVSTPTVIRYFPDRDALMEAFWDWAQPRLGLPQRQPEADEAAQFPPRLYKMFDEHAGFFRAMLLTREGRAERARRWGERADVAHRAFEPLLSELSPARKKSVLGLLRMLVSGLPLWLDLHDFYGIPGEEAGQAVAWALRILVRELKRNPQSPEG